MTRSLLALALLTLAACGTETVQNPPAVCQIVCNPRVDYACGSRCVPYEEGCDVAAGELLSACDGALAPAGR